MTEYDNTNRGALWRNDDMREGKKDPEFRGSINVDGVDYWVNGWKRKPGANPKAPALSLSVSRKDQNRAPNPANNPPADDFDDDIPF